MNFEIECEYEIGVSLTFSRSQTKSVTREAVISARGLVLLFVLFVLPRDPMINQLTTPKLKKDIPVIQFDDGISSCYTEQSNGDIYLVVAPIQGLPDEYEVVDYVWDQTIGRELQCSDRYFSFLKLFDCVIDFFLFLVRDEIAEETEILFCISQQNPFVLVNNILGKLLSFWVHFLSFSLSSCGNLFIYLAGNDVDLISIKLPSCEMLFLSPPTSIGFFHSFSNDSVLFNHFFKDGSCSVPSNFSGECVSAFSTVPVECKFSSFFPFSFLKFL